MIISKISYNRKFNLGNYETQDLTIEAQLNEKDNPLEVWTILADNTEMWHIDYMRKRNAESGGAAKSTPNVQSSPNQPPNSPPKLPAELSKHVEFRNDRTAVTTEFIRDRQLWGKINDEMKKLGYEWVSAGADSHWRVKA